MKIGPFSGAFVRLNRTLFGVFVMYAGMRGYVIDFRSLFIDITKASNFAVLVQHQF